MTGRSHLRLARCSFLLTAVAGFVGCASDDAATAGGAGPAVSADDERYLPDEQPRIHPEGPHAFGVMDLLAMERLGPPVVHPAGKVAVFSRRSTDLEQNRGRNTLWEVDLGSGATRQLTFHPKGAGAPAYSPDGKTLYFLSGRSGSSQVWKLPLEGGTPSQVTDLPLDVAAFRVSADGGTLVVSVDVFVDCPDLACSQERLAAVAATGESGLGYDAIFVRHWDTWKDGRRGQLFAVPAAGGAAVRVTRDFGGDVPPKPWWGEEAFVFTPDGRGVVFVAKDPAAGLEPTSTNYDLWLAPLDGTAAPRRLTDNPAWDDHPVFSPDGKTLVWLAMARPGFEADRMRVMARAWPDGAPREVAPPWDRSVSELSFTADGRGLLVAAYDVGEHKTFRMDLATGEVKGLLDGGHVTGAVDLGDRLVYRFNDLANPDELWMADAAGQGRKKLTHVNDARLADMTFGAFEPFSFEGAGGDTVHGWVVKPAGYEEGKRYPLAFLIHGGPQGSFSNRFHYRWNPQTYAGAGFAVVTFDFHGSVGYGQAFTDAIRGDWGGKPLEDLQKGLAAVTAAHPWIDGGNACALGASYGGYMINWIAGAWPDGFQCLVNHDGIFDQRSMYWATEELWFPEWEHGGPYYAATAAHERHNPANLVEKWKTPMLVVHGALDYRVPLEQGLQTFNALQRRGVESRLLVFPDENHWVLKPKNSIQWHREVEGWLKAHTEGGARTAGGAPVAGASAP